MSTKNKDLSTDIQSAPLTVVGVADVFTDQNLLNRMEKFAELMASGRSTVPQHLRGNTGDCMAISLQAAQWGMNPFAVAQKTHLVNGTMGYEAQLVNAVITSMAPTKDRLNFKWYGEWENVIGKFDIKRGEKGEYRVPAWKMVDEEGLGVQVWATLKGESEPRVLNLLLAQARVRNSGLWADDPKQQLAYLAIKRWARLYTPDVIMGVYTPDELDEGGDSAPLKIMGNAEVVNDDQGKKAALPEYTDAQFRANFPKWEQAVIKGEATPGGIINTVSSKYELSKKQISIIKGIHVPKKKETAKEVDASVVSEQQPAQDDQSDADAWLADYEGGQ